MGTSLKSILCQSPGTVIPAQKAEKADYQSKLSAKMDKKSSKLEIDGRKTKERSRSAL